MPLSDHDREIIYFSMLPETVISLLCCIFISLIYCLFISLQRFPFKVVFILSILDFFNSLGFIIPTFSASDNDLLCQSQASILQFFTIASVLWTTFIASSLYLIIVKNSSFPQRNWKYFITLILVISFIGTLGPFLTNSYGRTTGWCWIKHNTDLDTKFYQRYLLFFIPLWCLIFFNIFVYIKISHSIKNFVENSKILKSVNRRLKYYPVVLIVCFLPYTLKAFFELMDFRFFVQYKFQFTIIAGICRTCIGVFNGIVYGLTKRVRNSIRVLVLGGRMKNASENGILIGKISG